MSKCDDLIKDSLRCPHCQREEGKCVELTSVYEIIDKVRVRERDRIKAEIERVYGIGEKQVVEEVFYKDEWEDFWESLTKFNEASKE